MLAWEYPPLIVGGIGAHVQGLATALHRSGHDVTVLSVHHPDLLPDHRHQVPDDATVDGVRVVRARTDLPWLPDDFLSGRIASSNHHMVQLLAKLGGWRPDVVHAHDWTVAWAADTISALWNVPLVATIHGTERGRHGGHVPHGTPAAINAVEWWLTFQAAELIACSRFMVREVVEGFELPHDKVHLVPNGIDSSVWSAAVDAAPADRPLVLAWGRVQYEKGFQVLVRAMSELRHRVPGIRCVIAGRGTYLPELQTQIDVEGVSDIVQVAGFVPAEELRAMVAEATCVVIPSLYEPFGIVALEGMAAGAPTIAARTGGLAEILDGTDAGLLFEPGNHNALADLVERVVHNPEHAQRLRVNAAALLEGTYSWEAIAAATADVYQRAVSGPS
jgi:glycogen synthase